MAEQYIKNGLMPGMKEQLLRADYTELHKNLTNIDNSRRINVMSPTIVTNQNPSVISSREYLRRFFARDLINDLLVVGGNL